MQRTKLGNIVTKSKNNTFGDFFNVVQSCEDCIEGIPTLYIGLEKAKECLDDFSIMKKHYPKQNAWWTFAKNERRNDYLEDIYQFRKEVTNNALKPVKYMYINLPKYSLTMIKRFIRYVRTPSEKICYLTRESSFLFIFDEKTQLVFGLSLTLCEYMGVDRHKILSKIRKNKKNKFINGVKFMDDGMREVIGENIHLIPALFSHFGGNETQNG